MSSPLAIAAVTATFAQLLGRVIEDAALSGAGVTTVPPDVAATSGTDRRLNLFLYQVTPDAAMRNDQLPVRGSDGRVRQPPVAALTLHYLLTAFGDDNDELDAHHLLAHAMSLVNDEPVLSPEAIKAAIAAEARVSGSDLPDQVEHVRINQEPMSLDELSKLWGMFQDTHYRLSVAYEASVVLIERRHRTVLAPPVLRPDIRVMPLRRPVIEGVTPPIVPVGGGLVLTGRSLLAADVVVLVGGEPVAPDSLTDRRITLTAPADRKAGLQSVQVNHRLALGQPPVPHRGFESNVAAFMLAPRLTAPVPTTVARGAGLALTFEPLVGRTQRLSALIGDQEIVIPPATIGDTPVNAMTFLVPADFPTGTFLMRLRVDGAESQLEVDTNPASPTFDQFVGPNITVT
jgi:hypothetical protein